MAQASLRETIARLRPLTDTRALPFPNLTPPRYRPGVWGDWELRNMRNSLAAVGYWRGLQWVDKNVTLRHRPTGVVWTSLSPMELESQALHLDAMRGEVVIGGLGMGALAYSALQKPEVTRVTVVERDHEIVDALYHFASLSKWKNVAKLNVVFADVLCYRHPRPVDVLAVASVASGGRSLDLELGAPGARFYGSPPPIRLRRMVQAALPVGHRTLAQRLSA